MLLGVRVSLPSYQLLGNISKNQGQELARPFLKSDRIQMNPGQSSVNSWHLTGHTLHNSLNPTVGTFHRESNYPSKHSLESVLLGQVRWSLASMKMAPEP